VENLVRVALIGASSRIAQDLVQYLSEIKSEFILDLYSSRESRNLSGQFPSQNVASYQSFDTNQEYDVVVNFVGRGSPKQLKKEIGEFENASVFFDDLCLDYLKVHRNAKYVFLSSGAVYSNFNYADGASDQTVSNSDYDNPYANTKRLIEARHREMPHLAIYDIRVFGYLSPTPDIHDGSFFSEVLACLISGDMLITNDEDFFRDYCTISDFANLFSCIIERPPLNSALDLYSMKPVSKFELLKSLESDFGLLYSHAPSADHTNISPTGQKTHYFSSSKNAASLGYQPKRTSLDSCLDIVPRVLDRYRVN